MKLFIGNKAYSSWSLRGWLACKQSALLFEEAVVPLYDQDWDKRRQGDEFAPSSGKVPILWDGETVVWDSLAIIEHLNDKTGNERFWPTEDAARGRSEEHTSELQSLMRISYAVFCLKKKKKTNINHENTYNRKSQVYIHTVIRQI